MKNSNKKVKGYTLRSISKKECQLRGLFVYEVGDSRTLIALPNEHKIFKLKDNTTWGHLFLGGKVWGRFLKLRKNYKTATLICEKPQTIKLEVVPFGKSIYGEERTGEYYRKENGQSTYKHYSINGIAISNKAIYGHFIGTFIK